MSDEVWSGSEALRGWLVPIDGLEPFPGNARRGDVAAVAGSLRRFGQVKPITTDGARIVAGHHVVEAARREGWTHVAAVPNEFADEEEQRAFLIADNRTHDLGGYDTSLLAAQLRSLDDYRGTGYVEADVVALEEGLRAALSAPEGFDTLDPDSMKTDYRCPSCGYEWAGQPRPGGD